MRSKEKLLESLAAQFLESTAGFLDDDDDFILAPPAREEHDLIEAGKEEAPAPVAETPTRPARCDVCRRRLIHEDDGTYMCARCEDRLADSEAAVLKNAQTAKSQESNLTPAINDAFFGPPAHGLGPDAFVARISKPDSNFNKAAGTVSGKITVKVSVDAAKQIADFVAVGSGIGKHAAEIQKALETDYIAMYGKTPTAQLAERLASNQIRPPDIRGTATVMTV